MLNRSNCQQGEACGSQCGGRGVAVEAGIGMVEIVEINWEDKFILKIMKILLSSLLMTLLVLLLLLVVVVVVVVVVLLLLLLLLVVVVVVVLVLVLLK